MSTTKRKGFDLKLKYKIIKLIEQGVGNEAIQRQFSDQGMKSHNIYDFKGKNNEIIEAYEDSISSNVKSLRSVYPDIERKLTTFIASADNEGLPINTLLLKGKALEFAHRVVMTLKRLSVESIN